MKQETEAQVASPAHKTKQGHLYCPSQILRRTTLFSLNNQKMLWSEGGQRCSVSSQCVHTSEANGRLNEVSTSRARDFEAVILPEDLRLRAHYLPSVPNHKQWGDGPSILFTRFFYDTGVEDSPLHHGKAQFCGKND